MNNELFTPKELHDAEMLDIAIDSLRQQCTAGRSDSSSSLDIDPAFEQRLHADLVKRFSYTKHSSWKLWKLFGIPTTTVAVLTVGVMAAIKPELFIHKNIAATAKTETAQTHQATDDTLPTAEGQLAQIEPDLSDLSDINQDMQSTMNSIDDILDSIDSLDTLNTDTNSASTEIDQLPL